MIFELPHQDRLHTILLRYLNVGNENDVESENIGFDICTMIELQGPRDEENCFKRAKQTTIIRYITSQGNYNSAMETEFTAFYSKNDYNRIYKRFKQPKYSQEHKLLEYIVDVRHNCEFRHYYTY
jgi:hypothetical protein